LTFAILSRRLFLGLSGTLLPALLCAAESQPRSTPAKSVRDLWRSTYEDKRVWGYADRHSVDSGQPFNLVLSADPDWGEVSGAVEIFRIGSEDASQQKLVWRSKTVKVQHWPVQATSAAIGTSWPLALEGIDTTGWASGYYTVHFVDESGNRDSNIAYIVVTNPRRDGDVLLVLGTNTYNAYNAWGGFSLYESAFVGDRGQMLTFDRPASVEFFQFDYYLVAFLERLAAAENLKVDYATNWDLHRDAKFSEAYPLLISGGHNEYWSKEEFDQIYKRIFVRGQHTMFLGANAAYWQIRYTDVNMAPGTEMLGRQMVCFKDNNDPIGSRVDPEQRLQLVTSRFRDGQRRPETMLMGNAFEGYFNGGSPTAPRYPYFVTDASLPFFRGTGLKQGDSLGDIVGYEWDNTDPDKDGKRLWSAERSRLAQLPRSSIQVLFTGHPVDVTGKQGTAEAVFFRSGAGAMVFSAGTTRWSWGLGKAEYERTEFKQLNRNMVLHFLGRPTAPERRTASSPMRQPPAQ
jgi:hypothetical protein